MAADAPRLRGGRVDGPGGFPDVVDAYAAYTPGERWALQRALSLRLYALAAERGERPSELMNRRIGGRIDGAQRVIVRRPSRP
jgi:hypothetical protein